MASRLANVMGTDLQVLRWKGALIGGIRRACNSCDSLHISRAPGRFALEESIYETNKGWSQTQTTQENA